MRSRRLPVGLLTLALVGCAVAAEPDDSAGASDEVSASSLQCETDLIEGGDIDHAADAPGLSGDPVEAVSLWLAASLEAGDELGADEDVRRPGGTMGSVGVTRDGSRIALVHLTPASDGGWLVSSYEGCSGALTFP